MSGRPETKRPDTGQPAAPDDAYGERGAPSDPRRALRVPRMRKEGEPCRRLG
jgi:hypothetical protein